MNMRYFMQTAFLLLVVLSLAGCSSSGNAARKTDKGTSVEDAIYKQMEAADEEQSEAVDSDVDGEMSEATAQADEAETTDPVEDVEAAQAEGSAVSVTSGTIDYDLTAMNSNVVYATVYMMTASPEYYIGKIVRMSGPFYPCTNEDGTGFYAACIIEDALACCAQGMEFVWGDGSHVYPDEYPEVGTTITVTGTFETYQEDGELYCHLVDAVLED